MNTLEVLRSLTVARIAFWVVAAIPFSILLRTWIDPGQGKDGRFSDFVQGMLALVVIAGVTLVGIGVTIQRAFLRKPLSFWSFSTGIVSIPIIYILLKFFIDLISAAPLHPFDRTSR